MKKIELKDLPLKESDFVLVREFVERLCGHEWQMIRYEVRPQLIGVTAEVTAKEIYGHYYAVRATSDSSIFIEVEKWTKIPQIIEDMNRYYHVWQLGKHFGGNHTEDEAHEIFDAYSKYFDNREFPIYREGWNATKQEQAAAELGLGKRLMCHISRQDDKLYVDTPSMVYSTTDGIDVYVSVGNNNMVRLKFSPHFDTSIAGRSMNNNGHNWDDFDKAFDNKEPQRFILGKCTPKKRDAWFAYIKAYYDAANEFFAERNDAVAQAIAKLQAAGFTQIGDSNNWKCSKGYFDCKAEVANDGKIYTDISISYKSNVREEVFGI